jgi:hypothetical protein
MTGQVKEDILARYSELGVFVMNGQIRFEAGLLRKDEFLQQNQTFDYFDLDNKNQQLSLSSGSLAFTYCQTPFVYIMSDHNEIIIHKNSGDIISIEGNIMSTEISQSLFERRNEIIKIEVKLKPRLN